MSSTLPSSSLQSLVQQPPQLPPEVSHQEEMTMKNNNNNNKRTRCSRRLTTAQSLRSLSSSQPAEHRQTTRLAAEQQKSSAAEPSMNISLDDSYESEETCRSCHTKRLYTDWTNGDFVCRHCGVVAQESIMDDGPEWNTYSGENADATASLRKQRTAGPVRADGTLEPTSLSVTCYGGSSSGTTATSNTNNNMALRRRLARIQHVRDYQLDQQRDKLYRDVAIDLAIRRKKQQQKSLSLTEWMIDDKNKKRRRNGGSSSSSSSSSGGENEDDDDDIDIDDSDNDDATRYDDANADETTTPPPRHMILIEEHMEAQIAQEQFQWDETKRRANWRKWTLPSSADDDDDDPSDNDHDDDPYDPLTSKKKRRKNQPKDGPRKKRRHSKRERADIERARQTLLHAVAVLRTVADRYHLSPMIVNDTIQKFQYYGATHDTLPHAACAAILYLTSHGRYFFEPYQTNRLAVRKMLRRIIKQFPQWNNTTSTGVTGAAAATAAAAGTGVAATGATSSTTASVATTTATVAATALTTANAEAAIHAVLDRLKLSSPGAAKKTTPSTTLWRDATLAVLLGDDDNDPTVIPPTPATILAAVYFCATVAQKLAQLGLTTTNTIPPTSVAQLAKQAAVPASRIRTAYQTAPRDVWLDRVAQTVLPQALLVRQLLPNKAV